MSNFIDDIIKNANDQIKYKETVVTGEVTVDNGDGTYDVKIANAPTAYPSVETATYGDTFAVGEIAIITFEYGNKEMPRLWGHAKKIKQNPVQVEVDYSSGGSASVETIHAYGLRETTAYLEGEITLNNIGNCTRRGFYYGLTTAYGLETHEDGSYGAGLFSLQITGLSANTTYHFQAYVIDANGDEQVGEDKTMITTATEGWDISTAVYANKSTYVGGQDSLPYDVAFSSDGTKMYIMGVSNECVFQYTLSTAWDVSTATYANKSVSVGAQDSDSYDVAFSSDGTKMYIMGYANLTVFQYTLSTAWDVSTVTYANKSAYVGAQDSDPYGLTFSSDGTKMYIMGWANETVYQYTL